LSIVELSVIIIVIEEQAQLSFQRKGKLREILGRKTIGPSS